MRQCVWTVIACCLLLLTVPPTLLGAAAQPGFRIYLTGNPANVETHPAGGVALLGGGPDLDAAFRWMLEQSHGGDVVVIRASGGDGYNEYLYELPDVATPADSVTTIVFSARSAAFDTAVLRTIREADALIIAGGDQAEYIRLWQDTPLEDAIEDRVGEGMAVGGTSAGAAVLGEHVYTAMRGSVSSQAALHDPFDRRVTLTSGFLDLPGLERIIVDSHFSERNRQGRLVAFVARIAKGSGLPLYGIGLDEQTALLIDRDRHAVVIGEGKVLVIEADKVPGRCMRGKRLTYHDVSGAWGGAGDTFNTSTWSSEGFDPVTLSAFRGRLVVQRGA